MLTLGRGVWRSACHAPMTATWGPAAVTWPVFFGSGFHTCAILERARRGTRERKAKVAIANKKKKEDRLRRHPPPLPDKIVLKLKSMGLPVTPKPLRADESNKSFATDDVYQLFRYCYQRYEFTEAVRMMRIHFSPEVLDRSDDLIYAKVEVNMKLPKQGRYMDEFNKYVAIVHRWDDTVLEKRICAFVPTEELEAEALAAGAIMTGGPELIQNIMKGRVDVAEVDHFLCHDELAATMRTMVGVLREKTPLKGGDSVGTNIKKMIQVFKSGMEVQVRKVKPSLVAPNEPDYAFAEIPIGKLTQDPEEMRANLDSALDSLLEGQSKKASGGFITRLILKLEDGPFYTEYSIDHPLLSDEKLRNHQKARSEQIQEPIRETTGS
ncbi:hypothetical protein TCAL_06698 [Tigriopus californicus]|uniref:39S ribosomal protein L1, mitochondrial n=1 Tax=Tigriopus californicus TaxID=6832 RepID=A0A553P8M3_TIGCA|nr:uncharacterized protein LOC131877583 [Tigriopus californicus]TRY74028.1 hypothetical protein TCAL_06698 [Tigriopus californicus]